jgi:hypothetical protein
MPPDPPLGGHRCSVQIAEDFISDRGRRRSRTVAVDPTEIRAPSDAEHQAWQSMRGLLRDRVGPSTFEVWFTGLELIAVSAIDQALLIADRRRETHRWIGSRYPVLFAELPGPDAQSVRFATERELAIHTAVEQHEPTRVPLSLRTDQQEAI